jgi:hypothetical protein
MKEVFEKIKNRFKEKRDKYENLADSSNFHGYHEEELKYFGMQEAYEEAIEMVDQVAEGCKNKYVSIGVYEQVAWERDVAIEQLHELGYEFGEKIEDDWILCSDRLPKEKYRYDITPYWITIRGKNVDFYVTYKAYWHESDQCWKWKNGKKLAADYEVVAWKKYRAPKPYKPGGEL